MNITKYGKLNIFLKEFIAALFCRCPKCWKPLNCIRDWSGGVEGYGHYYCDECDEQYKI